jgi:hypothetical protein
MTTFLKGNSFIKKLYNQEINISEIYVPFVVDSDEILDIKE